MEKTSSTTTSSPDAPAPPAPDPAAQPVVLRIEGLGKKFSRVPAETRVPGLRRLLRTMAGIPTPIQPVKLEKEEFWALHDINFSLRRGESLGVIGLNGAGKSTLLKIILDRLRPDAGQVSVTGRPGGLIELAAGFHPEMTGRENISLNASLLGASSAEIARHTPAIITFADLGAFIDSPVKIYSSGMKVRLGFAIAIHFLTDLLVFDEILAVGDFEFRQKCLHKINELRADRTFLLVSHNLRDISRFCDHALLLHKGEQILLGEPEPVLAAYAHCHRRLSADEVRAKINPAVASNPPFAPAPTPSLWQSLKRRVTRTPFPTPDDDEAPEPPPELPVDIKSYLFGAEFHAADKIRDISFRWNLPRAESGFTYLADSPFHAEIAFTLLVPCPRLRVSLPIFNREGELILAPDTADFTPSTLLAPGPHRLRLALDPLPVNHGTFWLYLTISDDLAMLYRKSLARLTIHNPAQKFGLVKTSPAWQLADIDTVPKENLTSLL